MYHLEFESIFFEEDGFLYITKVFGWAHGYMRARERNVFTTFDREKGVLGFASGNLGFLEDFLGQDAVQNLVKRNIFKAKIEKVEGVLPVCFRRNFEDSNKWASKKWAWYKKKFERPIHTKSDLKKYYDQKKRAESDGYFVVTNSHGKASLFFKINLTPVELLSKISVNSYGLASESKQITP